MTHKEIYEQGFRNGLRTFAWWKEGEEQVGTCGTSLKDALEIVEKLWNFKPPKEGEAQ